MFRFNILLLLSAVATVAMAQDKCAVIIVPFDENHHQIKDSSLGFCTQDESKLLNKALTLAAMKHHGAKRNLRSEERRLDPSYCCTLCEGGHCWIAYPGCYNNPYTKEECPSGQREMQTLSTSTMTTKLSPTTTVDSINTEIRSIQYKIKYHQSLAKTLDPNDKVGKERVRLALDALYEMGIEKKQELQVLEPKIISADVKDECDEKKASILSYIDEVLAGNPDALDADCVNLFMHFVGIFSVELP